MAAAEKRKSSSSGFVEADDGKVKVVVRVRPVLARERDCGVAMSVDETTVTISTGGGENALNAGDDEESPRVLTHVFCFDHVYPSSASQEDVYERTARPVVESCLEGYNATIFAYGQTGSGKTYTQYGDGSERGIIPRAVEQIFGHHHGNATRFLVRASCLQIYQEQVCDLLSEGGDSAGGVWSPTQHLTIREDPKRGVYVEGLSEFVVKNPREVYGLMERAASRRATGATRMNDVSSRSHAVFSVVVEQSTTLYVDDDGLTELSPEEFARSMRAKGISRDEALARLEDRVKQTFRVGKLNMVDLAGSERVRLSGASGVRLEESKKINASLSSLGNVIAALAEKRKHVPYRDSKLTRLLEDSLGGNCRTTMLATVSPSRDAVSETLSTLKFATRAKSVTNAPRVNEDLDQKSLLRKYERELKKLRAELEERNRNVVDQRRLLELDEKRRQAEQDKMAAIRALEARSLDFMREKQEKQQLEERIARLTSQIVVSDEKSPAEVGGGEDAMLAPFLSNGLDHHSSESAHEYYESRLAELDRERQSIVEEKAQVERYKQLLLKQRDIMIALTQRLNERDEQIVALQDELDAYDKNQGDLENKLDEKTAQCIHLQRLQLEGTADIEKDALRRELAARLKELENKPDLNRVLELRDSERKAVLNIFEKKICVLVDSVQANVAGNNVKSAKRDIASLKRLVNASVEALRQAQRQQEITSSSSSSSSKEDENNFTAKAVKSSSVASELPVGRPPRYPSAGAGERALSA